MLCKTAFFILKMLSIVQDVLRMKKAVLHNMDITLIAQEPKLAPHIDGMIQNLVHALQIQPTQISIKATSSEWMGFTGRKEGIVALAMVCLDMLEN